MNATRVRDRHDRAGFMPAARRFLAARPQLEAPFRVPDLDVVEMRYRHRQFHNVLVH